MGKNHRPRHLRPAAPAPPVPAARQLIITGYPDRQPQLQCTGNEITVLELLATGLLILAKALQNSKPPPAPVEDRPRSCLGPREKPQRYDPES